MRATRFTCTAPGIITCKICGASVDLATADPFEVCAAEERLEATHVCKQAHAKKHPETRVLKGTSPAHRARAEYVLGNAATVN